MQALDLIRLVPRKTLSWLLGRLARFEQPRALVQACIKRFIAYYDVDTTDLDRPLESFASVSAFFSRPLRPDARPIGEGIVSPVDGVITAYGTIASGKIPQVKGMTYDVRELLGDDSLAAPFVSGGLFMTIYLAPPDYHRIHAPCTGDVTALSVVPGSLWPVNDWSVRSIPNVFCRNERLSTMMRASCGVLAVVKVGALNVGSISVSYDSIQTNDAFPLFESGKKHVKHFENVKASKGDELGRFQLGSTVVLLFEPGAIEFKPHLEHTRVRCGETIGTPR